MIYKSTTERLCALLRERHEIGLAHYGKTLDRDDYTPEQWLAEAINEQLDAAGYLTRLKDTITDLRKELDVYKIATDLLKKDVAKFRDVAENLYHELNDMTPERDCKCVIHGERCRSCTHESARAALHAWEGLK